MFGVAGYEPAWLCGIDVIKAAHGPRLQALVGTTMHDIWLLWDHTGDRWFTDGPVVLECSGDQLEINHQKFDELSITWNTIDLAEPSDRPSDSSFSLGWRADARPDVVALAGGTVRCVELLECQCGDLADGMVAVGVELDTGYIAIANGIDDNDITLGGPRPCYRRHRPC